MPVVSVIIPCYNHGKYLAETIDSVLAQTLAEFEVIVVNDGSTDSFTNALLADLAKEKTTVITTANQGLAEARNTGISQARGEYILPLDADDQIAPTYLEKAVAILEADPEVGIVYSKAELFGVIETEWNLPEYSLEAMLFDNIIFCSAIFRRDDWELLGGYDPEMIYGWEDYDFWLGLHELGRKVVKIPEFLFRYRVASDSMVRSKEKWQKVAMFERTYLRHQAFFARHIAAWIEVILDSKDRYHTSRLYVNSGQGFSDDASVCTKIVENDKRLYFPLSAFTEIVSLRFDPVDVPAVIELKEVVVLYHDGKRRTVTKNVSNALYQDQGRLYFDTLDAQFHFPGLGDRKLQGAQALIVDLRFHALGAEAITAILGYQKEKITAFEEQIKARGWRARVSRCIEYLTGRKPAN